MIRTHRIWSLVAVSTALVLAASMDVRADEHAKSDAVDWTAKAKEAWSHTCQKCHTTPDVAFETDRGFLAQIMETT